MEALYHQTNKQIQEIQSLMGGLESADRESVRRLEDDLHAKVDHIFHQLGRLEAMKSREPPLRRQNAKRLLDQLAYDAQHLKAVLGAFRDRRVRETREREREELLSRTFTANDATASAPHTSIAMDDETLRQNAALRSADKDIDNFLDSGGNILSSLRDQRGTLKGTHKRMLDVGNMLGLSTTVMRSIESRVTQDRFFMIGAMLLTCVFMFLVMWYMKG